MTARETAGRLRVVHVITRLELGGAQQNTLYTLAHLDPGRFSGLLVTNPEGILVEEARTNGGYDTAFVPALTRPVRPGADLRALLSLRRLIAGEVTASRREGATVIVHTHSSKAGILGRAAARLAGAPVIIHSIHGYGFHDRQSRPVRGSFLFLERLASRWTTHFIAVSRADREEGIARGLFSPGRVSLIRSGIEIDRFSGAGVDPKSVRARLGLPADDPLVGMVACFKPQKNPVDFVRLAARVAAAEDRARFVVAGDGVLRPRMEEAVRRYGLGERLSLLGWRRDVDELIPALDVLVLTSLWEGLPRVFPQAMAAGRPVVAYRVGGAADAVADGTSGFLVKPGDVEGAAQRVIGLLRDPARAAAMGSAGRERVGEFDAREMVRRQEELYERLAAQAAAARFRGRARPAP